jgi:hypothetical protein
MIALLSVVHRKRVLNFDGAYNQPFVHVFAHERAGTALNGCGHNVCIVKRQLVLLRNAHRLGMGNDR